VLYPCASLNPRALSKLLKAIVWDKAMAFFYEERMRDKRKCPILILERRYAEWNLTAVAARNLAEAAAV
jgi:hypothetical protein